MVDDLTVPQRSHFLLPSRQLKSIPHLQPLTSSLPCLLSILQCYPPLGPSSPFTALSSIPFLLPVSKKSFAPTFNFRHPEQEVRTMDVKIVTKSLVALLALTGSSDAFWRMSCSVIQEGRIDPIVSPGKVASHVHKISGASSKSIRLSPKIVIFYTFSGSKKHRVSSYK